MSCFDVLEEGLAEAVVWQLPVEQQSSARLFSTCTEVFPAIAGCAE
ncbi:hypothetical protein [Photobacterium sanctipauli]|nr:hypothetical protein [Photobacterium sanctipauli]